MGLSIIDWAYIVVGGLLGLAVIFAMIAKLIVWVRYARGNSIKAENGLTGELAASLLLQRLDMQNVQVKKMNWFVAILYGNHYNARRKTIYLRGNIFDKSSITAIGLATQKIGLAILDRDGDKKFKVKAFLQPWVLLAPILFVPLSLVGIVIDLVLFKNLGVISIIFVALGFLYYLASFILTLVNMPVERKANKIAFEMIEQTNILEESEQKEVQSIYKAYMISYVADFITSLLYLLQFILKILRKFQKKR